MAIQAQCDQCGFRYSAPDTLAGRKVRCKRCSAVFTLPAGNTEGSGAEGGADAGPWGEPLSNLEVSAPASADAGARTGTMAGAADSIDAILSGAHAAEGGSATEAIRETQAFDYPHSREVDRFLPPTLAGIALLLVILQTLSSEDLAALDRGWVVPLRIGLVALLYTIVIFPLAHLGVKKGIQAQRAHMPWSPLWKSFALFSFPTALGYTLWMVGRNVPSLLLGCIAGLAVALTGLWLLYRIRLDRGLQPLVYGAVAFLVALGIAGGIIAGINHTAHAIALGSQTAHEFASSPVLPGLAWDNTPPPPSDVPLDTPMPAVADAPGTGETDTASAEVPQDPAGGDETGAQDPVAETPPTAGTEPAPAPGPDPAPPGEDTVAVHPPDLFSPDLPPAPPVPPRGPVHSPPPRHPPAGPDAPDRPAPPAPPRPPAVEPSAFVEAIEPTGIPGGFDRVIYPLTPAEHLLVVRRDGEEDRLERWHTPTWKQTAHHRARSAAGASAGAYAISPDGAILASIMTWPTLSVQTWSFDEGRITQVLELDRTLGEPGLVGFISPHQLIVHWQRNNAHGLELWDLRLRRGSRVDLPGVDTMTGNFALSPDGRTFAIAARSPQGPVVSLYAVGTQRVQRQLPIRLLDAQWGVEPSGLTFSADGTLLSALFEKDGNALICSWRLPAGRELQPMIFPAGALAGANPASTGHRLAWLNGHLLIHGTDLVDGATGRILGRTGLGEVLQQHVTGPAEAQIVRVGVDGAAQLVEVMFDATSLAPQP